MAKKRIQKKRQKQEKIKVLEKIGVREKKAKKIINNPEVYKSYEKEYKKLEQKEKRRQRDRQRSEIMKKAGIPITGKNRSMRGWSEKRFNEYIQEHYKQKEREQKAKERKEKKAESDSGNTLLIFWRDKTANGDADRAKVNGYMREYRYVDTENLLDNIRFYLTTPKPIGAEIGTFSIQVVRDSEADQYINFMRAMHHTSIAAADANEWVLVYKGKAKRYKELIHAVHTMVRLLYDTSERAGFVMDLIQRKLAAVNPRMAERLAKDIGFRRF